MSSSDQEIGRRPDKNTGISGPLGAVQSHARPEILFNRPTGWHHPQEVLRHGVTESVLDGETALFDVLPGIGKSRSIPKVASGTGLPITILTNLSENYDQYRRWGREDGITVQKLPVAPNLCPTFQGDYQEDPAAKEAREAYNASWPAGAVHREFDVPCDRGGHVCPYREATAEIDPDGPKPLVGHFTQAYNPAYIEDRIIVIDEACFDHFVQQIKKPVEKAEEFITTLNEFPFENVRRPEVGEEQKQADALEALEEHGLDPAKHSDSVGEFHARSPLVAYAIYGAERIENGLHIAKLPNDRTAVFDNLLSDDDDGGSVWILDPPDFSKAKAVIALDATPCVSNWRRILRDDLRHHRLFDDDQRNRYLREQGHKFIQINSYAWPAQGGRLSIRKCEASLREIYRKHGERPDLITSKDTRDQLENEGLDYLWREDMHFGDLRGKNDLADSELLVVLGSPSRPDRYYEHLTALHGEFAERVDGTKGMNLSFGSPIADDILETVRRGGVLQAAMRAGRTEDAEATVYIATGLVPDWLETKKIGRRTQSGGFDACYNAREESDRKVLHVLQEEDGISGREVARRAELPKSTTLDALNRLCNEGLVEKVGRGRGTKWHSDGVEDVNIAGNVDLERMADISLKNSYVFSPKVQPRAQPVPVRPSRCLG